jgi:hypothetical protein
MRWSGLLRILSKLRGEAGYVPLGGDRCAHVAARTEQHAAVEEAVEEATRRLA